MRKGRRQKSEFEILTSRPSPLAPCPISFQIRPQHDLREDPGVAGIAAREAARFGSQAVGPFEADAAHPARGPALFTSEEIDGRADAKCSPGGDPFALLVDPQFLLGSADSDDQEVRLRSGDLSEYFVILFG